VACQARGGSEWAATPSGFRLLLSRAAQVRSPVVNFKEYKTMSAIETAPPPVNQQGLEIRPTPRAEMNLYPLDTFPYEFAGREITVSFEMPEFTAICPFSDFPDFANIRLAYVPGERCVELKSLKLYINSFRNVKIFHEHVVNVILEDFVRACDPLSVELEGDFNIRGNIKTVVRASYKKQ
jgi:7-cyano-7-deazaguanine reductase